MGGGAVGVGRQLTELGRDFFYYRLGGWPPRPLSAHPGDLLL